MGTCCSDAKNHSVALSKSDPEKRRKMKKLVSYSQGVERISEEELDDEMDEITIKKIKQREERRRNRKRYGFKKSLTTKVPQSRFAYAEADHPAHNSASKKGNNSQDGARIDNQSNVNDPSHNGFSSPKNSTTSIKNFKFYTNEKDMNRRAYFSKQKNMLGSSGVSVDNQSQFAQSIKLQNNQNIKKWGYYKDYSEDCFESMISASLRNFNNMKSTNGSKFNFSVKSVIELTNPLLVIKAEIPYKLLHEPEKNKQIQAIEASEGFRRMIYEESGDDYYGGFLDNLRSGFGVLKYGNGDFYVGEFSAGKTVGNGVFYFGEGGAVRGIFGFGGRDGCEGVNGRGVYKYGSGARFSGTLLKGKPSGKGKLRFFDF